MTMKKESKIKNLADLRHEISRLKLLAAEQESYLNDQYLLFNEKIEAPVRFFKSATSWIPGVDLARGLFAKGKGDEDWVNRLLRIGFPVVLNRFFLRRAGLVKRVLATLVSQQAASVLNKESVAGLIDKITHFIRPAKKQHQRSAAEDYGIPPDSETY